MDGEILRPSGADKSFLSNGAVLVRPLAIAGEAHVVVLPDAGKLRREKPRGLLSGAALKSGYLPRNEPVYLVVNKAVAGLLLLLALPLFLTIMVLQKITSPGDIFYRGERYGLGGRIFHILKFRTLESTAAQVTNDRTLPRRNLIETPMGGYLRATRLDELPQLVNILRGEMVFFGPRPVRPELEPMYRREQPNFRERFRVRPGLAGLAQAMMSHETPKSIRGRFNTMCCRAPVSYPHMAGFVIYVGFCVVRRSIATMAHAVADIFRSTGGHRWLRSGFTRPSRCHLTVTSNGKRCNGAVCGISDETVQFVTTLPLPAGPCEMELVRVLRGGRRVRVPVEADVHTVVPLGLGHAGFAHYARYTPRTPLACYRIDRYFIQAPLCA